MINSFFIVYNILKLIMKYTWRLKKDKEILHADDGAVNEKVQQESIHMYSHTQTYVHTYIGACIQTRTHAHLLTHTYV